MVGGTVSSVVPVPPDGVKKVWARRHRAKYLCESGGVSVKRVWLGVNSEVGVQTGRDRSPGGEESGCSVRVRIRRWGWRWRRTRYEGRGGRRRRGGPTFGVRRVYGGRGSRRRHVVQAVQERTT